MHNDGISRLLGWPEGVVQEHTRRDGVTGTCATVAEIIPQMPAIMRFKGWTVGATLMEGWLRRPYNNDPEQGIHDSTTVRMAWVLSFPRVREVFDEAVAQKVWVNQAARDEIIDMLKKQHLLPAVSRHPLAPESVRTFGDLPSPSPHPFGASSAPSYLPAFWRASSIVLNPQQMLKLDERYLQHRPHHQTPLVAPMDDLTAALARFDFRMLVQGDVCPVASSGPSRYRVTVRKVGIYVRDSYDFNDDDTRWSKPSTWISQPLGFWSCHDPFRSGGYAGKNSMRGRFVSNKDFRYWRSWHGQGRGGDYLVFSDICVLETNDVFEFNA